MSTGWITGSLTVALCISTHMTETEFFFCCLRQTNAEHSKLWINVVVKIFQKGRQKPFRLSDACQFLSKTYSIS